MAPGDTIMPDSLRRTLQRTYLRDWKTLRFPRGPVDSTVEEILWNQELAGLAFVWFWPDGAPSCAIVTHDVETAAGRDRCS